jgi:hypothetical protein
MNSRLPKPSLWESMLVAIAYIAMLLVVAAVVYTCGGR